MNPRDQVILDQAVKTHEKAFTKRLWEMTYAHDRREHRHKCQCCGKIVQDGEDVVMYRFGSTRTRVIHLREADLGLGADFSYTWRQLALTHAYSHSIR